MQITFLPQQVIRNVEAGVSLLQGASEAGVFIDARKKSMEAADWPVRSRLWMIYR